MKNMMLQVRNFSKIALCVALLLVAGCKGKDEPVEPTPEQPQTEDPFVTPGNTEDPHWVRTVENDMSSSMTAIVKVSFAAQPGTLAAFMGNDCCGVAEYKADYGLYWLYISPAADANANVQLRFYSPELKRIFDATSTFPFRNDTQLGSITEPYTPEWAVNTHK